MGILEVFGHFFKKVFNTGPWNLGLQAYCGYFQVCVNKWLPMGQIFQPFLAQIRPIYMFSSIFFKSFHWIHLKLDL